MSQNAATLRLSSCSAPFSTGDFLVNIPFPLVALLLLVSVPASAVTPASGLWWNPDASGSGFEIDRQGSTMTLAVYAYDHSGAPLWYLVPGYYDDSTSTFYGTGNTFTGGQCLGCDYTSPAATPAGDFTMTFTDAEHGTLAFPGGGTPIEHFAYGYASKQDYLIGEWVFSVYGVNSDGTTSGGSQWIVFDTHATQSDGTEVIAGHADSAPDVTAIGAYDAGDDTFTVVISGTVYDAGTGSYSGYQDTYTLQGDDRAMTGTSSNGTFFPGPAQAAAFRMHY